MATHQVFRTSVLNLTNALMYMPIPIGVINSAGHILLLNEAFTIAFGYRVEDLKSVDSWMELAYPDALYRAEVIDVWGRDIAESLETGNPTPRREYRITTRAGEVKRVMVMVRKVDDLLFTTLEDVTQNRLDEEALAQYRCQLEDLAYNDQMLHLPNRHRFTELVAQEINRFSDSTLALLDIDDFSSINNALGHQFGDDVLLAVVQRLLERFTEGILLARVAGDTFGIMGPKEHVNPDVLGELFVSPLQIGEETFRISATSGLVKLVLPTAKSAELIKDAELALRHAKSHYRGKAQYFNSEMITQTQERMRLLVGLRDAFEDSQFFVAYQPQVRLSDGHVTGMEALVRWRTKSGEFISPDRFIPIAEHSGLIVPLGEFVLRASLYQLRQLHKSGFDKLCMSVNVSIIQLREPDFPETLNKLMIEFQVAPEFVELEVTESTAMSDVEFMKRVLLQLRNIGVAIAIDDFGTGYSSLGALRQLPINRLKIDKAFVDQIETNSDDRAIVQLIIELTKQLKLDVIAEGVENEQQKTQLANMGCQQGQGYLFARPMAENQLREWLKGRGNSPINGV
ncbi:putative bifunctional diguanylate cyclase/phosphodiesterase [Shewanella sp.]|uniref:putative bifunctional diguanylate cyclase/phosphodiesterase n=1 Tax=Shewanella sp. TaxID=50422 RepID=UPI003A88749D